VHWMMKRAICARPYVWVPWVDATEPSVSEKVLDVKEVAQGPAGGGGGGQFQTIVPIRPGVPEAAKDGEIRLSGLTAGGYMPGVPAGVPAGAGVSAGVSRVIEAEGRA